MSWCRPGLPRWAVIAAISGAGVLAAADAILERRVGIPWYQSIPDALVGWAYITGGVIAFRAASVIGGVVAFRARRLDRTGMLMTSIGVIWNLDSVALYVHALRGRFVAALLRFGQSAGCQRRNLVPWSSAHSASSPYGLRSGSSARPPAARTRSTAAAMSSTR